MADGLHDAGRDLIVHRLEGQDERREEDRPQRAREQQARLHAEQPLDEDKCGHKNLRLASQPERRDEPADKGKHLLDVAVDERAAPEALVIQGMETLIEHQAGLGLKLLRDIEVQLERSD
eukprot:CAMPEP_0181226140 /NCGR_PEP_ID=MMETSP1096-20121128/32094_1 /TAXON_ID=156174 ORGANISM="Chrysochromulina ericina, Strain CCMP281" /NCGR_SAMPLE_ID=MMETSP1096 /ASSEMBLY_ACC=CAM_ASM_000453 /LENGTH=119 /DNA_ID=CAMNT_0023319455 /DNA_START=695 /DNA_END=1054 /DNA_ORIENTATION=-